MKNKKLFSGIILSLAVVMVMTGLIGYFFFVRENNDTLTDEKEEITIPGMAKAEPYDNVSTNWQDNTVESMKLELKVPSDWDIETLSGSSCVYDNNDKSTCLRVGNNNSFIQIKKVPGSDDLGGGIIVEQDVHSSVLISGQSSGYFRSKTAGEHYEYLDMDIYVIKSIDVLYEIPLEDKYTGKEYGEYSIWFRQNGNNYNIFYFIDSNLSDEENVQTLKDMDKILSTLEIDFEKER